MAQQNDLLRAPLLALSLLTRLPVKLPEEAYDKSAGAVWAYPLVGLVTGVIAAAAATATLAVGLPLWVAALVVLASTIIATGAMHEDGLADTADGFWGGWDAGMRLKIMKDSQIGTYGVLALLGVQALRVGALYEIIANADWIFTLIAVHVASRSVMPVLMAALPHAREDGLARSVGPVSRRASAVSAGIGTAALIGVFGALGFILCALLAGAGYGMSRLAMRKIGGQTGDVLGATQQISETVLLLAIMSIPL